MGYLNEPCIGLFGTCGDSTWRQEFIDAYQPLGINFYNPQVTDWKPDDAAIEAEHLISDEIVLFPVTGETYGTGSLAETGYSIINALNSIEQRYAVIYIEPKLKQDLIDDNPALAKESSRARSLVLAHLNKINNPNVFVVDNLEDMLDLSIELYAVVNDIKHLRDGYHKGNK